MGLDETDHDVGLEVRKSVFTVSEKVIPKPSCSATKTT